MFLFSLINFLTVSRRFADSSPNTIRPLQSTIKTPSMVRVLILSCTGTSWGLRKQGHCSPQSLSLRRLWCKQFVVNWRIDGASGLEEPSFSVPALRTGGLRVKRRPVEKVVWLKHKARPHDQRNA